jgi:endonuclease-3
MVTDRTRATKISALLLKKYPAPKIALKYSNPLELLIATILSARCTDVKVNEVTESLFGKYKTAADYAEADLPAFEQEIRPTGFYRNKAKTVINCCRKLVEDFGGRVPATMEELTKLPGVGRKTANVVLGSAFGQQTMAVDTHVLRVARRLGLTSSDNPDKVEEDLCSLLPAKDLTRLNLALILHGRETCSAARPKCNTCILFDQCRWPGRSGRGNPGK